MIQTDIVLITATHNRPCAFELLEHYVSRFTVKPAAWYVACSAERMYDFVVPDLVVQVDLDACQPDTHPMNCNFLHLLPHISGARKVCVLDDDDWYHPEYLEVMDRLLKRNALAGVVPAKYYHVPNRAWMEHINHSWASLACTGFTDEVYPAFCREVHNGDPFIDKRLWDSCKAQMDVTANSKPYHVGIKDGSGIGIGHCLSGPVDPTGAVLRKWIGEDADWYLG